MKTIALLSTLAIAASISFAAGAPKEAPKGPGKGGPPPAKMFKKLDTNNDKSLSLEEFKASPRGKKAPAKAEKAFNKIDKDSSGSISLEEFKTQAKPQKGGKAGKGGKKGKNSPAPANQ